MPGLPGAPVAGGERLPAGDEELRPSGGRAQPLLEHWLESGAHGMLKPCIFTISQIIIILLYNYL